MNLYGLIGYPLGHSFSKQYFTEKFLNEGLSNCTFENFAIPSIDEFLKILQQNITLKGMAVTIPYKQQVLSFVNELSDEVIFIGAANCIKIADNKLIAYNTDIIGFEKSFVPFLKPNHKKALILGTGGASKAVQYVLNKLGINYLLVSRSEIPREGYCNYAMLNEQLMNKYQIIINCSPVGTFPHIDNCPDIPYEFINASHYLYDLVYKPDKTLFLQKGEEQKAQIKNGYEMLIIQAEANWAIWNED